MTLRTNNGAEYEVDGFNPDLQHGTATTFVFNRARLAQIVEDLDGADSLTIIDGENEQQYDGLSRVTYAADQGQFVMIILSEERGDDA